MKSGLFINQCPFQLPAPVEKMKIAQSRAILCKNQVCLEKNVDLLTYAKTPSKYSIMIVTFSFHFNWIYVSVEL